ncbi:MAG TPA: Spo0B domain-containing protein [Symbiobacteriaceae bacterium]|nr:Spo0B domain-containing protein [Symbiobacteriaceae bacterium]
MNDQISAAHALHLLRRQRHSFLNHLQVISGWLQLDRPERAKAYLETVAAGMTAESEALRPVGAALGLLMLELGLEAETHGARLQWTVTGTQITLPDEQQAALREQVLAALERARGGSVLIHLAADGFSVHTPSSEGEG